MAYETILLDRDDNVGIVTLNRPEALNALSQQLMNDMTAALQALEADDEIGCIVMTGSEKAFAAGADIKEMAEKNFSDVFLEDYITANWEEPTRCRKPIIAAVNGFALGGGCEVAMMCDMMFAGENAKFGQPEIKLGVIPGAGGSQRLTRAIGKYRAMDMILTGRVMNAQEAFDAGLVSRIFPTEDLVEEAVKVAKTIANLSRPSVFLAKEAVNRSQEVSLSEGVLFERRTFHSLFGTEDQKEGMAAFIEKRHAEFKDR
ncbi:MAG: enoyl-CoA hydratase [Sphingomonadales bacterium]